MADDDNVSDAVPAMLRELREHMDERFAALFAQVGGLVIKLDDVALDVAELKGNVAALSARMQRVEVRIGRVDERIAKLEVKVEP